MNPINHLLAAERIAKTMARDAEPGSNIATVARLVRKAINTLEPERLDPCLHSDVVDAVQRHVPAEHVKVELVRELTKLCHVRTPFTLRQLQDEQKPWATHNFPNREPWHPLLGAVEEVGELAHAHLKTAQGIRGTPAEHYDAAVDAVADVVIYLADYCTLAAIDFHRAVESTWQHVKARDWKANPVNADKVAEAEGTLATREPMPTNPDTPEAHRGHLMPTVGDALGRNTWSPGDEHVLGGAEVESVIVDTIELEADDYQSFDWPPVTKAIERIRELANGRVELLAERARDEFVPEFVVVLRNEPDGPDLGFDLATRTWVAFDQASVLGPNELAGLELSGGGVITKLSTVGPPRD